MRWKSVATSCAGALLVGGLTAEAGAASRPRVAPTSGAQAARVVYGVVGPGFTITLRTRPEGT